MVNNRTLILILIIIPSLFILSCKSSRVNKSKANVKSKSHTYSPKIKNTEEYSSEVEKILTVARSYTGTRYKYGGSTRSGIDCSGLVCVAFKAVDVTMPRTSAEQSLKGKKVSINDIQEGDLLFFTDKKGHKKVTHVGIVTQAREKDNVKFIHSSTKLGVVEDNLYAEYYLKLFLKAMRIL